MATGENEAGRQFAACHPPPVAKAHFAHGHGADDRWWPAPPELPPLEMMSGRRKETRTWLFRVLVLGRELYLGWHDGFYFWLHLVRQLGNRLGRWLRLRSFGVLTAQQ